MGRFVAGSGPIVALVAFVAFVASAAAPGCHLAGTPDPIQCPAGEHPDTGKCVQDDVAGGLITIQLDDAGACSADPAVLTVMTTGQFQFTNDDNVEHVVMGVDGQTWATVPAHQSSPFIGIVKPGHWDYDVSGCAKGGTVSVE